VFTIARKRLDNTLQFSMMASNSLVCGELRCIAKHLTEMGAPREAVTREEGTMKKHREDSDVCFNVSFVSGFLLLVLSLPILSFASTPESVCFISDDTPTVVIDGCDTGVANTKDSAGCTIWQRIMRCGANAKTHNDFTKCVSQLTGVLQKTGVITSKEKQKIQKCASRAAYPCSDCGPMSVGERHFRFETAKDDLSVALKKVYDAYVTFPASDTNFARLRASGEEGIKYLKEHADKAASALTKEASKIDSSDLAGGMVIFHLMSRFESKAGIQYLFDRASSQTPSECTSEDSNEEKCKHFFILRKAALNGLGDIGSLGSQTARTRLLDLVGHEDASVQREAVKTFYETGGVSRWRAKRTMAERLPSSKHYLLHEIY
jgi:hypothetical protein